MIRLLLISLIVSACTLLNREPTPAVEPNLPAEESQQEAAAPPKRPAPPKPVKPATPKTETVKSMCGPMSQNERERFIQALDCLLEADEPAK